MARGEKLPKTELAADAHCSASDVCSRIVFHSKLLKDNPR